MDKMTDNGRQEALVSVLIPCYDDGQYLPEAVASVNGQTWKNVEIIIVDDGSRDQNTLDVLKNLETRANTVVVHAAHKGPAAARNEAFRYAKGQYIFMLDSDDKIAPEYIQTALRCMEERPAVGVCYCHADRFGMTNEKWLLPDFSMVGMLAGNLVFVSALIRREVFEQVGGFDESMVDGLEDYDFFLSVLAHDWRIYQLPETFFYYRKREDSRSVRFDSNDRLSEKTYRSLVKKHQALYTEHLEEIMDELRNTKHMLQETQLDAAYLRRSIEDKSIKGMLRLFLLRHKGLWDKCKNKEQ